LTELLKKEKKVAILEIQCRVSVYMQLAVTASNSCNNWSRCTANRYIIDYAWCMRRSIYINITRLIRYRRPTFEYRVITARRYADALLCCGTMSVRLSVTSRVVSKRL